MQPFQPRAAGIRDHRAALDELEQRAGLAAVLAGQAIEGLDLRAGIGRFGHAEPAAELLQPAQRRDHLLAAGQRPGQRHRFVDVQPGASPPVPGRRSIARASQPGAALSGFRRAVCQVAMLSKCDRFGFG